MRALIHPDTCPSPNAPASTCSSNLPSISIITCCKANSIIRGSSHDTLNPANFRRESVRFHDHALECCTRPLFMPPALAAAHQKLDTAVDRCYRAQPFTSERQRFEYLFALYESLIAPLTTPKKKPRAPRKGA